uniref:Reverse transcriptase Ty1/copia-type domain-containing protein n=1 Tax=Solanum lycopersicum TaxID=4081 RepID=A0A3Q7IT70_SOLLC
MKDLGPARQIFGMQIVRDRKAKKLVLSQEKYIQKVLRRFSMDKAKVVSTPLAMHFKLSTKQCPSSDDEKEDMKKVPYASAVGSLMYAMWVMRYLYGTSSLSLCFGTGKPILCGYTDSDMAGDVDTRKSTSGYLVTFAGGAVSWQSRLQKCVALSTTEAELIAVVEACKELFWMKIFLGELGCAQERSWISSRSRIEKQEADPGLVLEIET